MSSNKKPVKSTGSSNWSSPIVTSASSTYTWADETLAKHHAERSKPNSAKATEFITSAENPREIAAIEAGKQRGRMSIQAFDKAWKMKK